MGIAGVVKRAELLQDARNAAKGRKARRLRRGEEKKEQENSTEIKIEKAPG